MKKLNIMFENELLTPLVDPVSCGLQKQFPISWMSHFQVMNRRMLIILALVVTSLFATTRPAQAIPYTAYITDWWTTRAGTWLDADTYSNEDLYLAQEYKDYKNEQAAAKVSLIGQPAIYEVAGISQSPGYPDVLAAQGQTISVDFGFVDPTTGLPTAGPLVASVAYLVNVDPLSAADFVPIGTSSDAASGFSISYLVSTSFEPLIEAIPYDASGNPIVVTGVDGDNVAQGIVGALYVPEPSAIAILGIGAVSLLARRKAKT